MWGWFVDNSLWVLIASALVVIFLLFFSEKARNIIASTVPAKQREKAVGKINAILWTLEGIVAVIMIVAFVAMTLSSEGAPPLVTTEAIKKWFLEHGIKIVGSVSI